MYGTYLIACHVEHTQFHHLFQLVVFGGSCQFVVAQVQYLNLVTALTVDEVIPVFQQHIAWNFLVAGHIQHLEFRQFRQYIHRKGSQLLAVVNLHVGKHGEVVPAPFFLLFFKCFAVSR